MAKKNTHYMYALEDSGSTYSVMNPDNPNDPQFVTFLPGVPVPQDDVPAKLAERLLAEKHIIPCPGPGTEEEKAEAAATTASAATNTKVEKAATKPAEEGASAREG